MTAAARRFDHRYSGAENVVLTFAPVAAMPAPPQTCCSELADSGRLVAALVSRASTGTGDVY